MTNMIKPYILVDLDDTLFQTHRRVSPAADATVATLDKQGQPLSYMNNKQKMFVTWMSQSSYLLPVTARSVEALSRVQLPFEHGAVCSHGGTVLNADGSVDQQWHAQMTHVLQPYQALLQQLTDVLLQLAASFGSIRTWVVEENGVGLYAVAKQNDASTLFLKQLITQLPDIYKEQFYIHSNGNNLAIIPNPISKANAVRYVVEHKLPHVAQSFVLGFGDSLSDLEFLAQCDWFGMPKNSQAQQWIAQQLTQDYQQKGHFGHDSA